MTFVNSHNEPSRLVSCFAQITKIASNSCARQPRKSGITNHGAHDTQHREANVNHQQGIDRLEPSAVSVLLSSMLERLIAQAAMRRDLTPDLLHSRIDRGDNRMST